MEDLITQGANVNFYYPAVDSWILIQISAFFDSAIDGGDPVMVQSLLNHGSKITDNTYARFARRRVQRKLLTMEGGYLKNELHFKANAAARQQIAIAIISNAAKENFIGTGALDLAAPSAVAAVSSKTRKLKSKGLKESDLNFQRDSKEVCKTGIRQWGL